MCMITFHRRTFYPLMQSLNAHYLIPAFSEGGTCYDGVRCGYIFFVVDGRGNILYRRIVMMPREGWGFLYQVKQAVWVEPCCAARAWIGPTGGRGGVERVTARGNAMYWDIQSLTIRVMGQI